MQRMILLGATIAAACLTVLGITSAQSKKQHEAAARKIDLAAGQAMFLQYCASCHGTDAKGNGPAAAAMKVPPPDLTQLSKRNQGTYPAGYVGALLKFGRSLASHGSEDMPVWGARFKAMDPSGDPTGQQHVDDLVAYVRTLQAQ
ncbi:MAG TPA: cytochrome c [Candidatus Methylomirabilis sp.]|nr:cytochrome c [Candidatus Methylomirabilis sp.]